MIFGWCEKSQKPKSSKRTKSQMYKSSLESNKIPILTRDFVQFEIVHIWILFSLEPFFLENCFSEIFQFKFLSYSKSCFFKNFVQFKSFCLSKTLSDSGFWRKIVNFQIGFSTKYMLTLFTFICSHPFAVSKNKQTDETKKRTFEG